MIRPDISIIDASVLTEHLNIQVVAVLVMLVGISCWYGGTKSIIN